MTDRSEDFELNKERIDENYYNNILFHRDIKDFDDIYQIGKIYEEKLDIEERKSGGQYYTDKSVADYIVSRLKIKICNKIIDPACGCGVFLLSILDKFQNESQIVNNLFGVDINQEALNITKYSILKRVGYEDKSLELLSILDNNFKKGNAIVSNKNICNDNFIWEETYEHVLKDGGFDLVIGNPPYVTMKKDIEFDPAESIYSNIINGHVNSATLMIGKAIEITKEGGFIAFVLPKNILHVKSYKKLRHYILRNLKIIEIYNLGSIFKGVRGEQIILILKKEKPNIDHKIVMRNYTDNDKTIFDQPQFYQLQSKFKIDDKILLFENNETYDLLEKLSNIGTQLIKVVDGKIFRGISIGANSENIFSEQRENTLPVLRGKNISKLSIKDTLYISNDILSKFSENSISRLNEKKIVLQNIFSSESGIIAAYDEGKLLTLDTVTNIVVGDDVMAKYLISLLSSKLLNFFLIYGIYNCSKLTMHTDKEYIGKLPIAMEPNKSLLHQLLDLMDEIVLLDDNDDRKADIMNKLNQIIYEIYGLNNEEVYLIEKELEKIFSKNGG